MENEKKKHPLLKKNIDAVCLKNFFDAFFGHGCVASHVASDTPRRDKMWK